MTSSHNYSNDLFPLHISILLFDKTTFVSLIKKGIDLNQLDENGQTPIIASITSGFGDLRWIRILLKKGANVNQLDEDGDSALDIAKYRNRQDIVELLLEFGAKGKEGISVKQQQDSMFYDDMSMVNFIRNISKNKKTPK